MPVDDSVVVAVDPVHWNSSKPGASSWFAPSSAGPPSWHQAGDPYAWCQWSSMVGGDLRRRRALTWSAPDEERPSRRRRSRRSRKTFSAWKRTFFPWPDLASFAVFCWWMSRVPRACEAIGRSCLKRGQRASESMSWWSCVADEPPARPPRLHPRPVAVASASAGRRPPAQRRRTGTASWGSTAAPPPEWARIIGAGGVQVMKKQHGTGGGHDRVRLRRHAGRRQATLGDDVRASPVASNSGSPSGTPDDRRTGHSATGRVKVAFEHRQRQRHGDN